MTNESVHNNVNLVDDRNARNNFIKRVEVLDKVKKLFLIPDAYSRVLGHGFQNYWASNPETLGHRSRNIGAATSHRDAALAS
jgi:hypothetical protein